MRGLLLLVVVGAMGARGRGRRHCGACAAVVVRAPAGSLARRRSLTAEVEAPFDHVDIAH